MHEREKEKAGRGERMCVCWWEWREEKREFPAGY